MKVLSIKEPYATLIMMKEKQIETRSFKTNYRGELYIHASGKTLTKEALNDSYVRKLIEGLTFHCGNIICKATLKDCVYMDEAFMDQIKKNPKEYRLGVYEVGRYAWILEDIQRIDPIPAKGRLNIWNYHEDKKL